MEAIAADGVSQLVVRVRGIESDAKYHVSVIADDGAPIDVANVGGVATMEGPRDGATSLPLVSTSINDVKPVTTVSGPELYFV